VKLKPYFLFVPGAHYSVEEAYEEARTEHDADYSPHGAFRKLTPGYVWEAIDFVNEFGPLDLLDEQQPRQTISLQDLLEIPVIDVDSDPANLTVDEIALRPVWVDLDDFWGKHRRFRAVAELWEARGSLDAILSALAATASLSVYPRMGARRHGDLFWGDAFPWEDFGFNEWERTANEQRVRTASTEIIKAELDLHGYEMNIRWVGHEPPLEGFRMLPSAPSLWPAMWHLFARDTSEGLGWRICPHCSKLFYPKRKDSFFCESKYQKLHAANRWWHEHKETELENRRAQRSRKAKRRQRKAAGDRRTLERVSKN
jgi:hypothetical protein